MSICANKEFNDLKGNIENFDMNGCDIKYNINSAKDCSGSQDLFSDDDQTKDSTFHSPKVQTKNDTFNESVVSLKTPILYSKANDETPGKALVPKTPADLLPFITKTNLVWTSDMETPQSKLNEKSENCDKTSNSINSNTTPKRKQCTPNYVDTEGNKMDITSPILGGKKRSKRRVKRRILNKLVLDTDNNNDQQSSISSNSDRLPSETICSASSELAVNIQQNLNKSNSKENNDLTEKECIESRSKNCNRLITKYNEATFEENKENKKLNDANIFDKNSNTSTQEFFSNASFSSIDQLCTNVNQEEKTTLNQTELDNKSEILKDNIAFEEKEIAININHDILEKVARIRRNQKPFRRSMDINHTVIPKELFSKSAMELELADANFSQQKQKSLTTLEKPLELMSFAKLSCIEDELITKMNKSPIKENNVSHTPQDVPIEIMDEWNLDIVKKQPEEEDLIKLHDFIGKYKEINTEVDNQSINQFSIEKENSISHSAIRTNEPSIEQSGFNKNINKITDGFSTANGTSINISEDKILDYAKVYNEIENDNLNENSFLAFKINNKPKNLQFNIGKKSALKPKLVSHPIVKNELKLPNMKKHRDDKKLETLKLYQELDLKEFLEPKFTPESTDNDDSFTITSDKEDKNYAEINDESSNIFNKINISDPKKSKVLNLVDIQQIRNKDVLKQERNFDDKIEATIIKTNSAISNVKEFCDGFSTAGGKDIKVDDDKEKYYLNIYNKLDEDISIENMCLRSKLKVNINNKKQVNADALNSNKKKIRTKLSISSDTDKAFYDLGDLEEFLVPSNQAFMLNKGIDVNNCFVIPNSTNILNKINQISTNSDNLLVTQQKVAIKQENKSDIINNSVKHNIKSLQILEEKEIINKENLCNQKESHSTILKRKLDSCEIKRPERCRSFGGFPLNNNDDVSASKLNKSDPVDESFANLPLHKGMSVSQCFDSHSDSLLSKVELSYLNNSKVKSPDTKVEMTKFKTKEKSINCDKFKNLEFFGFTFQECTESFREYAKFKKYLKKQCMMNDTETQIFIGNGQTISISNQTLLNQQLSIHYESNLVVKRDVSKTNYILSEMYKLPKDPELKLIKKKPPVNINEKVAEKRKHADTDNDTPLTTLKKPRVGSELQGRKLFSDESDEEQNNCNKKNSLDEKIYTSSLVEQQFDQVIEEDLSEERFNVILQQEKIIRNKKRIKIKPTMGSLLKKRLANGKKRYSWIDLVGSSVPEVRNIEQIRENNLDTRILEVTASNATCYKFLGSNIIGNKKVASVDVGDGALLIFDENGQAGVSEFTEAFLAMPGVDPKLIPSGWIENHYRWIVWKLASMDRIHFKYALANTFPQMLTLERVMQELKYRYDREIDRAQRPALRKILEKDDVPTRRMVLCISSIKELTRNEETEKEVRAMLGLPRWKIEATDGWYSIPLTIDNAMCNYIATGKVKEGTKIVTYGAELLECERGFFPLEKPDTVSLKIYTNCTRRARWDTKLGFQKNSGPIPVKLRNIVSTGGMIGEITAVAARIYPLMYREKTADGQSIYRNARSEEKAAVAYERAIELKVDAMYAEVQKKFDSKNKSISDEDADTSQNLLVPQSKTRKLNYWENKQEEFRQKLELQVRQGLPPPRQVTPVQKIRLVDDKTTVILTIWGANEDSGYDIKEGNTISVYNSYASGLRGGELNLTANRITHIKVEPLLKLPYPCRTCTLIPDMENAGFEPKFCELDTIGIVVSSGSAPYGMKNFEMVNLAYPKSNNSGSSYLSILFWNGISSFGYQGMLTVGSVIACSNLEWRRNTSWNTAVAYCSEKTLFTCNPRQQHLVKELRKLKSLIQNPVPYAESCIEELNIELAKKPKPRSNQGTPSNWTDRSHFFNSAVSPMDVYSPSNAAVQRRLEKLSRYGSSAEILPIILNNSSTRVQKDFTPVTRKDT